VAFSLIWLAHRRATGTVSPEPWITAGSPASASATDSAWATIASVVRPIASAAASSSSRRSGAIPARPAALTAAVVV
jgi:hypothetical protein